jgi:hypothetical protein
MNNETNEPAGLPDYDAGVLARELGLDPEVTTSLSFVIHARWIGVRWHGYKRISSAELEAALAAAIAATKPAKVRRRARKVAPRA